MEIEYKQSGFHTSGYARTRGVVRAVQLLSPRRVQGND